MLREGSCRSKVTQLPSGRVPHLACVLYQSYQPSLSEWSFLAPPSALGVSLSFWFVICIFSYPNCLKAEKEGFEGDI